MPTKKKVTIKKDVEAVKPKVVKQPKGALASDDPKFPPIAARDDVLKSVWPAYLIAWANRLGKKVETRAAAKEAILRHEYGDAAYDKWAKA